MLAQESDEESFAKDYVAHATLEPAVAQAAREDASAREFVASSVDQGTIESRAAAKRAAPLPGHTGQISMSCIYRKNGLRPGVRPENRRHF